ncbi:MAG TPA: LuxR C-terminal-related transcriptional regulator [Ramlibacter sp.]|uniref:LuxR C-terminal-related transcriptional regulator n=1 Tax=Ramlibacter sp. TaxID=1917967 RepID=UPI002D7F4736|nr:LuxR C-terminal-related transcriptional regulator [Ramlibacter sp.]HET8747840.1 LuxR C-terminal-related transcriptional regulator [Ramlibacter sp.]
MQGSSRQRAHADLLLKVTPPRAPGHLVPRADLQSGHPRLRDVPVLLVQAPGGFGKTSLLAQWRREQLALGGAVAWVSAAPGDDLATFVQALALAVRVGAHRPAFGHVLLEGRPPAGLEGVTLWLAEVAQGAIPLLLCVDEADRLAEPARDALAYLLHNLPPNLRCAIAARSDARLDVKDLVASGQCVVLGAPQLRFGLEQTLQLVRARLGAAFDGDEAARLHDMTEGWPLGVQLALGLAQGRLPAALPHRALTGAQLRTRFVTALLGKLEPQDLDFLTRISIVETLHPGLCTALVEDAGAPARLERLAAETPVFVAAEQGAWLRMHSLVRDALRQRVESLPQAQREALHARASRWLLDEGLLAAAALHAFCAGQHELAATLAERSLYDATMEQGRGAGLEWVWRLPREELDRRPRLQLALAWTLALSDRHAEASARVHQLLQRHPDAALRRECDMILVGAALCADEPDRVVALLADGAEAPEAESPRLAQIAANGAALGALLQGQPALARLRHQQGERFAAVSAQHVQRWGHLIAGWSYLWEGQVQPAAALLQGALAATEEDLGRRSPFATLLAALLAAAVWEQDQPAQAEALLANRLDVLEETGIPECVLCGFRTLARAACAAGAEHRALDLLGALEAVGTDRTLPRLRVASLAEQVWLHARSGRADTCRALCARIGALLAEPGMPDGPLWQRGTRMLQSLAEGYAALAAQDWRGALQPLERADEAARALQQGRVHIEVLGLRALALERSGHQAEALLREALDLAAALGLRRVFGDAHPQLAQRFARFDASPSAAAAPAPSASPPVGQARPASKTAPASGLTAKEREVLQLAAGNLTNKEIGLAMQVGEETIKWHMKNLFAKLDAGTRKQVVQRARLLGLMQAD